MTFPPPVSPKKKKVKGLTITAISALTGHTRESVSLALKGIPKPWGQAEIEIVRTAVKNYARPEKNGSINIDPDTKLTWQQKKLKMEADAKEMANEETRRLLSDKWMTVAEHEEMLREGMDRLEQVPGKLKSEFGLSDAQTKRTAEILDELRESWAKEIEK